MKKFILVLMLLLFSHIACAWWETPHMLIAEIAYQHLTPEVRKRVDVLIAHEKDGYDFVTAAVWADDIREAGNANYNTWHYVTLKFKDPQDPLPTREGFPSYPHVAWAIEHEQAILRDLKASETEKGLALRRLIHWVGDIHQPMHTTTHVSAEYFQGDRGGTLFILDLKKPLDKLHHLWDSGLGKWMGKKNRSDIAAEAAVLVMLSPKDLGSMDPYVWAMQHHVLGREYVYSGITYGGKPSAAYIARGVALSRAQVALAGMRLAVMLNDILSHDG